MERISHGKINIGIVGLNFGRSIINQIVEGNAKNYFQLTVVCDIDESKAKVGGEPDGTWYDSPKLCRVAPIF